MRVVVALGLAQAPAPHLYAMSGFTRSLASPTQSAAIRYMWALQLPTCQALPTFLNENGYENPNNPEALTAFNRSKGTENRLFDYLRSHLDEQKDFASCMIGYAGNLTPWTSIFPTEQLLGCDTDNVLVVDVGGGVGHDLLHIAEKHSLPATRLILQDLTEVVSAVKGSDKFRVLAHDFFTPQPVKGMTTGWRTRYTILTLALRSLHLLPSLGLARLAGRPSSTDSFANKRSHGQEKEPHSGA